MILNAINFKGVKPPYKNNGYEIYPISKDFSINELEMMVNSIKPDNFIGSGLNGNAYKLNDNYVIKETKVESNIADASIKEGEKLNYLFDTSQKYKLDMEGSQMGIIAFKSPDGKSYLVSTVVKGKSPEYSKNPFNFANLSSLLRIITSFDKGGNTNFRIMQYDYNGNNIKITENKAGILDMEYLAFDDVSYALKYLSDNKRSVSPHISDTSILDSNLRSFEFNELYHYLMSMPENEALKLFKNYLSLKANYHLDMADYFANKLSKSDNAEKMYKVAEKEYNHFKLLNKKIIDIDILKAEAIKIQIAKFIFDIYNAANGYVCTISPKQINMYLKRARKFINQNIAKSISCRDKSKARYFQDCKYLINLWHDAPHNARVFVKNKFKSDKIFRRTLEAIVK